MKILIVTHYFKPHIGGIEIVAYHQAKSLIKQGHEVTIVTSKIENEPDTQTIDGITIKRIKAINLFENIFNIPYPILSIKLVPILVREIKRANICHIHDVFYITSLLAAVVSKILKKPLVLTQHVGYVHANQMIVLIQKVVYKTIGKLIFIISDKIIIYNPVVASFVKGYKIDDSKIIQLKNGVDLSLFSPAGKRTKIELRKKYDLPLDKKIVLFVGRFVVKKGYDKLFDARSDKYLIVFIGSGRVPRKMTDDKNVVFLHAVSQAELSDYYKLSDLFVLPSSGEIFTLAMQEAMASGLPVITTKEKEYKYYNLNENHIKFITSTSKEIKQNINKILMKNRLINNMKHYSYNYAKQELDWNKNVLNLIAVYKEVIL